MNSPVRVAVGLGSNLGQRKRILLDAWQRLSGEENIEPVAISPPYESVPLGMESEHLFLNAAGIVDTTLAPIALLRLFQQVEADFGRQPRQSDSGYQDRLLDLDILYYGDMVHASAELVVPHPEIRHRLFVLAPLVDLIPDFIDPLQRVSVTAMHQRLLARILNGQCGEQKIVRDGWGDKDQDTVMNP
ncbi:MAG: 2-amino-4-hydroxy-6-hydroxymethyldihydropteridine diphosphokinase [Thermodesulfobacteriota bacterium]